MPLKPEVKAKQKARQEAEWARQRGEVPASTESPAPDHVPPYSEDWHPVDVPAFPIHATADEVLAAPDKFPPVVVEAAKEMIAEATPRRQRAPRAKAKK
ncbi:MAG TPA: hypothetical protein DCS05_05430 [Nitrospiraceae bacterium]|nr:hypothetical protein [Nitrospiraceae bacterium]